MAMIPPIATTGRSLFGMLNIIENPIAEMAAATAYIQYGCSGTIGIDMMSGSKLNVHLQNLSANTIPKAMPTIISIVLMARSVPTRKLLSSISSTKLIRGTPGTMNNAQASSGCSGVLVHAGRYVVSHATRVDTNAAIAIEKYWFTPSLLKYALVLNPMNAANDAYRNAIQSQPHCMQNPPQANAAPADGTS